MTATISRVGVIGAGTMGNGIAQVCAVAGMSVVMLDVSQEALARGRQTIAANLERLVKKEKLSRPDSEAALGRIECGTEHQLLAAADLVIEAATERIDLKLRLLQQVEAVVAPDALIASNTSSISITQLAAVLRQPGRFIGLHFFNPVPVLELVEVIRGLQTTDDTQARVTEFARRLGKQVVQVRNSPGFAVNRILCMMLNEAIFALQEGIATAEEIDLAMKLGCNHPIGPLALADLVGLDTLLSVMMVFHDGFHDSKYRPAPLLREMVDAGRLGRKSGVGFFRYD